MNAPWPTVALGRVLQHRKEFITINDLATYRRPRVQLHAQGIVLRDELPGALIKTKQQQVCRSGEFLVAEIDAKVGGFGVVPPGLRGAIVSSHYFLFQVDDQKLDRRFLDYFVRTRCFRDQVEAQGSTNYAAIRPSHVLGYRIPLPPLPEQQRIVARIGTLAHHIAEARRVHTQIRDGVVRLSRSILSHEHNTQPTPMRSLVTQRAPDVIVEPNVQYRFAGVLCFGRGMFLGSLKFGSAFSYPKLTRLHAGDFVYPKLMAWEGAFSVVPQSLDGCVVSTEFPVFQVHEDRVLREVLDVHFRTPTTWPELSGVSKGTNVRRRRLKPEDFLNYKIPLPSRATQEQLRAVRRRTDELERPHVHATAQLDALLPAILDRAFKGDL